MNSDVVAEGLSGQGDQRFATAGDRVGVIAHTAANLELDGAGTGGLDESFKDVGFLLGSIVAVPAGHIDGDLPLADTAEQIAHGLVDHAAE